ncbi:hypothetical protein KQX54_021471 [Cotesia glomerata]|uniref:Uncharacterized protein n=1 Tax=Cotesia glomerata TaxID=32391 RepID=A0AAV7JAH3_COTGL|nr:hypothetical protein KQX54_021471 [Cotesia glomerata]
MRLFGLFAQIDVSVKTNNSETIYLSTRRSMSCTNRFLDQIKNKLTYCEGRNLSTYLTDYPARRANSSFQCDPAIAGGAENYVPNYGCSSSLYRFRVPKCSTPTRIYYVGFVVDLTGGLLKASEE